MKNTYTVAQDVHGNALIWASYENFYIPVGVELSHLNHCVEIEESVVNEEITASRENNQMKVNSILSRFL